MKHHHKIGESRQYELIKLRRSELPDSERVGILQRKLYQKAKQETEKVRERAGFTDRKSLKYSLDYSRL